MRVANLLLTGLIIILPFQPVCADADAEREALAQITNELNALEVLIRKAESQAEPDARIRFRYDWLRQDLSRIQQGIRDHINVPRPEPRTFPSLRGDYRR